MIFMPPRHGKSALTTVRWPVWLLEQNPDLRIILAAYGAELATTFSREARSIAHQRMSLAEDRQAVHDWKTVRGGGMRAVGVGSGVTGQGAHIIIVDDPVEDDKAAESPTARDHLWEWYTKTLYTRLEPGGVLIVIMTRWHEDDLAGRLLSAMRDGGERWEVVTLPALAEEGDPLGRLAGEALCPDRYTAEALHNILTVQGPRAFDALYQQRPRGPEGALFKREWFTGPNVIDRAPEGLYWVRYWDLAVSTKTTADYTASGAVAIDQDQNVYIRDVIRGRWEWPDARRIIIDTMRAEPNVTHCIEKALHGYAAVQELNREASVAHVTIKGIDVESDKITRALPWQGKAELRKVFLVRGAWITPFLDEVCAFPVAPHDDQVDFVSGGYRELTVGVRAQALGLLAQGSAKGW